MTDHDPIDQAIAQLRQRAGELTRQGLATAHDLARDIDQLHAVWLARYTTPPQANSALGAFGGRER